ncbi:MAG: SAM-dependent methyltransferase [Myxococcota bacterium]|nr:SAM-dependent methyltransferase [Myxococcota bacterium]
MDSSSSRSTTAEGAAFCRALGALERSSVLRNPDGLAHHFVTRMRWRLGLLPGLRHLARRDVERRLPGALLLHHVRTRVFDDVCLSAVREGALQVVLLGAGGDSRAYRFARELEHVRVYEVDHPETSAWKQACVARMLGRLPAHVRYVPLTFGSEVLATGLAAAGFDSTLRTFFLWEGVTMYLRSEAVDAVLSFAAQSVEGSAVAFDFLYADAIAHPVRFQGAAAQARFAASRGESFTFGLSPVPDDLAVFVKARGLDLAGCWDHRELRAAYPGEGLLMPYVGVVHARVPSKTRT